MDPIGASLRIIRLPCSLVIDENDSHAGIAEFFERVDSAETGAKDDHMGDVSHSFFRLSQKAIGGQPIPRKRPLFF